MESGDPEYVHQMRVGLRRLNAALGLFRDVTPCPQALRDELRWIRLELGVARDRAAIDHHPERNLVAPFRPADDARAPAQLHRPRPQRVHLVALG